MDQLGKILQHYWKERLKISRTVKFQSDLLKTNEDIAPQSRQVLQTFAWWGGGGGGQKRAPPPPYKRLHQRVLGYFFKRFLRSCFHY